MDKSKKINLVIQVAIYDRLKTHCDKFGFSVSEYIRSAIVAKLTDDEIRMRDM